MTASKAVEEALAAVQSGSRRAWLVGGAVRDQLLGRPTADYDVVVDGDAPQAARAAARAVRGHAFELSEGFGAWRVVPRGTRGGVPGGGRGAVPQGGPEGVPLGGGDVPGSGGPGRTWQLDLVPLLEGSIEADLGLRDFTINALAQPLGAREDTIDPFGGRRDLDEGRLRMVSSKAFERDPLRSLRLARLACETGFQIHADTAAAARRGAPRLERVSPERIFEEFRRILTAPGVVDGLEKMDELAITAVVLPELAQLHGVEQSRYHHLDVHAHTMSVLAEALELERAPERQLGPRWQEVNAVLSAPLANQLSRWQALRFAALLHDVAKPQTRAVSPDGRVTFMGHDAAGAKMAVDILTRLRASQRLREYVAVLVRNHLRLGFLVHERPLAKRSVYRYLKGLGEFAMDVTVLTVADRLATRGERSADAIAKHLELARRMLDEALTWRDDPPRPPLRGDELAQAIGLAPGPALGQVLGELEEASFAGEVTSRTQAVEWARRLLERVREEAVGR